MLTRVNSEKLVAVASVTFNNSLVIRGIKLIYGKSGFFLSMPSYIDNENQYKDICFLMDADDRTALFDAIFAEYEAQCEE